MSGYRGFPSKAEYEAHYSDPAKYAAEIPAMEAYTREAELPRKAEALRLILDDICEEQEIELTIGDKNIMAYALAEKLS